MTFIDDKLTVDNSTIKADLLSSVKAQVIVNLIDLQLRLGTPAYHTIDRQSMQ